MNKRPAARRWTLDDEAELRALWEDGVRGEALGAALGRTGNAADSRALLLGLKRPGRRRPSARADLIR